MADYLLMDNPLAIYHPYDCRTNRRLTDADLPEGLTVADLSRFCLLHRYSFHSLDMLVGGQWVRDPEGFRAGDNSAHPTRGVNLSFPKVRSILDAAFAEARAKLAEIGRKSAAIRADADLADEAFKLSADLSAGHFAMSDAIAMIEKLAARVAQFAKGEDA